MNDTDDMADLTDWYGNTPGHNMISVRHNDNVGFRFMRLKRLSDKLDLTHLEGFPPIQLGYAVGGAWWSTFDELQVALEWGRKHHSIFGVFEAAVVVQRCTVHDKAEMVLEIVANQPLEPNHVDIWHHLFRPIKPAAKPAPLESSTPTELAIKPPSSSGRRPVDERRCAVYLHYDADDVLLYVGIAEMIGVRTDAHAASSAWTEFAVRGEHFWYPNRAAAAAAETRLIKTRRPLFNDSQAVAGRDQRLAEYLASKGRSDLLVRRPPRKPRTRPTT